MPAFGRLSESNRGFAEGVFFEVRRLRGRALEAGDDGGSLSFAGDAGGGGSDDDAAGADAACFALVPADTMLLLLLLLLLPPAPSASLGRRGSGVAPSWTSSMAALQ